MTDWFTPATRHFEDSATRGRLLAHRHKEQGLTEPLELEDVYSMEELTFAVAGEKIEVGITYDNATELYAVFGTAYYDEWDEE